MLSPINKKRPVFRAVGVFLGYKNSPYGSRGCVFYSFPFSQWNQKGSKRNYLDILFFYLLEGFFVLLLFIYRLFRAFLFTIYFRHFVLPPINIQKQQVSRWRFGLMKISRQMFRY